MLVKLIEKDFVGNGDQPGVYFEKTSGNVKIITGDATQSPIMFLYDKSKEVLLKAVVDIDAITREAKLEGKAEALLKLQQPEIINVQAPVEEQLSLTNVLKLIAVAQKPELAFGKEKK